VDESDRQVGVIPLLALGVGLAAAWPRRPTVLRRLTVTPSPRPTLDRRLLVIALAGVLTLTVSPVVGLAVLAGVHLRPRWVEKRELTRRRWAVVDAMPEAADLLALSVAGGLTVPGAVAAVARWAPEPVGAAFTAAAGEIALGQATAEVLEDVGDALGAPARPLVDALIASERYGAPLGDSLDRVARETRLERRRRGEERARRVPVLLLFPLVLCVLPAFGFLTVVPLLVGSLPDLPP
jgi:Flp pilus assembly protein TadB